MLYIRQLEQGDIQAAERLIQNAFADQADRACYDFIPENTMIFLDGDQPVGLCSYKVPMEDLASKALVDTAFIDLLYLTETGRTFSFTDGLLRAMLNLIEKRGFSRVFVPACPSDEDCLGVTASQLAKVGLDVLEDESLTSVVLNDYRAYNYCGASKLFKADLPEFFGRLCRSEQNAKAYS